MGSNKNVLMRTLSARKEGGTDRERNRCLHQKKKKKQKKKRESTTFTHKSNKSFLKEGGGTGEEKVSPLTGGKVGTA